MCTPTRRLPSEASPSFRALHARCAMALRALRAAARRAAPLARRAPLPARDTCAAAAWLQPSSALRVLSSQAAAAPTPVAEEDAVRAAALRAS